MRGSSEEVKKVVSTVKVGIEGHYDVREMPCGKDYLWQPAHALIECDCGQVMDADEHHTTCSNCGVDNTQRSRARGGGQTPERGSPPPLASRL
jgi:hypothetical protein